MGRKIKIKGPEFSVDVVAAYMLSLVLVGAVLLLVYHLATR